MRATADKDSDHGAPVQSGAASAATKSRHKPAIWAVQPADPGRIPAGKNTAYDKMRLPHPMTAAAWFRNVDDGGRLNASKEGAQRATHAQIAATRSRLREVTGSVSINLRLNAMFMRTIKTRGNLGDGTSGPGHQSATARAPPLPQRASQLPGVGGIWPVRKPTRCGPRHSASWDANCIRAPRSELLRLLSR